MTPEQLATARALRDAYTQARVAHQRAHAELHRLEHAPGDQVLAVAAARVALVQRRLELARARRALVAVAAV